jgi:hypothetical protein
MAGYGRMDETGCHPARTAVEYCTVYGAITSTLDQTEEPGTGAGADDALVGGENGVQQSGKSADVLVRLLRLRSPTLTVYTVPCHGL